MKNTATWLYGYPIYLKNDAVNIVISSSYRLLTDTNRTTATDFDSDNRRQNELRHFTQKWAFLHFTCFKRRKYSFSSPIPSMQCCANVWATYRKQPTPNLERRGRGRGTDSFVLWSYPIWMQCLNNFVASCSLFSSFVPINLKPLCWGAHKIL